MLEYFKNIYVKNIKFNVITVITLVLIMYVANSTIYDNYEQYRQLTYLRKSNHSFYYLKCHNGNMNINELEEILKSESLQLGRYELTLSAQDETGMDFYLYEADNNLLSINLPVKKGRWIDSKTKEAECVIGTGLAGKYNIGDSISIIGDNGSYKAKVVGILKNPGYLLRNNIQIDTPKFSDILRSYGNKICITNHLENDATESISSAYVIAYDDTIDLEPVKKEIDIYSYETIKENTQKQFAKNVTTSTAFIIMIFVLIAAMMCISIYTTTYCQKDTIEIYRTCGADKWQIITLVMGQTTVTLLTAVVLLFAVIVISQNGARGQEMFGDSILPHVIWTIIYCTIVEIVQYVFLTYILFGKEPVIDRWR